MRDERPSNRLTREEIASAPEALAIMAAAYESEAREASPYDGQIADDMRKYANHIRERRSELLLVIRRAELKFAADLGKSNVEIDRLISKAITTGDYSILAI